MDDLDDDLWWACRGSNLEQVKNLIQKGANVNYQDDVKTPLMVAVYCGQKAIVKFLLSKGADVMLKDDKNRSVFDHAKKKGYEEISKILSEYEKKIPVNQTSTVNYEKENKNLLNQIEQLKKQHQAEIDQLKEQYQSEKALIQKKEASFEKKEKSIIESNKKDIANLKEAYEKEKTNLTEKLNEKEKEKKSLNDQIETLIANHEKEKKDLENEIEKLRKEYQNEKDLTAKKQTELNLKKEEIEKLIQTQEKEKKELIMNWQTKERALADENFALTEEIRELNDTVSELTKKHDNASKELNDEITKLKAENEKLRNKQPLTSLNDNSANEESHPPKEDTPLEIKYDEIEKGKHIGEGGFGIVFGGRYKKNNSLIALKQLKIGQSLSSHAKDNFNQEIGIMCKLKHSNITQLIGVCKMEDGNDIMVLEFLNKGSLYHQLHERNIRLPLWLQIKLAIDIMKGILYLHQFNPKLVHRDLKSHNVLLDNKWNGKLTDFGLTKVKFETQTATGIAGTFNWMAPESLDGGKANEKVDIYSFGMVLYEMATNLIPFKGINQGQIVTKLIVKKERPILPGDYPPKLKEIVVRCWEGTPSQRPTAIQTLAQLELLLFDPDFKKEFFSSEWDFTPDLLSLNEEESDNNLGWKHKENYQDFTLFEVNVNALTFSSSSLNYEIKLDYTLSHTIEYCEWNRIENIIKKEYYCPFILYQKNMIQINTIYTIQNEKLNLKFKSNIIKYDAELESNPELFGIKTWEGDKNEKWRDWLLDHFKSLSHQFHHRNGLSDEIKVIPLFYFLKNEALGWKICSQGFNSSNDCFLENGWMGKGIYFSSNLEYLLINSVNEELKVDSKGEYSVLLCYVIIDNAYPCVEDPKNSQVSLKGKSNKEGYSCHFSLVKNGTLFSSSSPVICKENESEAKKRISQFAIFNPDNILPKYLLKIKKQKK